MDNHNNRNKLPNMSWPDLSSSSMEEQAAAHHGYHHHDQYQFSAPHHHHHHHHHHLLHNQQQQLPFSPSPVWPNLFPLPLPLPSPSSSLIPHVSLPSSTHVPLPPPPTINPSSSSSYIPAPGHDQQHHVDQQVQTSSKAAGGSEDQVDHQMAQQENEDQQLEQEEEDDDELDELGAMKEMMYKIAAMQPVDIDPATIRKPKRRNVRISDDPQSIAARHRRERISEKIRILQRLVPGGTKMDTASMLEEAVRYVKFLKREIRTLQQNNPMPSDAAGDNNWQQQQGAIQLLGISNTMITTTTSMEGRSSANIIEATNTSHGGQVLPLNITTFMTNQG